MTAEERAMWDAFGASDNLEIAPGETTNKSVGASLANVVGNPQFKAQFDITVKKIFTDLNGSTANVENNLPTEYKIALPFAIFGQSDSRGGYSSFLKQCSNIGKWIFVGYGIIGTNVASSIVGSTYLGNTGDMVFKYRTGNSQFNCYIVVQCKQVSYGTLLAATTSDVFTINSIRYKTQSNVLEQFANQIILIKQSLFGNTNNDEVSPLSYKKPEQFQEDIVDIPIIRDIFKETMFASYMEYACKEITWSIFVKSAVKVK